jgi:recombination protein RecR
MQFSSCLLENAVNEFAKLPGIGKKTALRLVLHLLKQDPSAVQGFGEIIIRMRQLRDRRECRCCICDVIEIEMTQQYSGTYHVLVVIISILDGIGPDQLNIEPLISRIHKEDIQEIIFALSPNIQGDTTIYYIQKKLSPSLAKVTTIARGIAFGGELEYADEMTLARSITNRQPVENYVSGR